MTASPMVRLMRWRFPYRLVIVNFDLIGASAKKVASDFVDLIREIAARGVPVEIVVHNSQ